ncbi:MAG: hypothetical protein U5L46_04930 [Agrobacterium sp.]|nr:hypothetical protein [Agrobacterium sp.]
MIERQNLIPFYNPPHSHINGDYLKGSYLGYYYLFFLIPEIDAYAVGETHRFITNSWEPKGLISPYWLTKVEPAVELGSGKAYFRARNDAWDYLWL